jgi:hypothetical protein
MDGSGTRNARLGRKKLWVMLFGAARGAMPMAKSPKTQGKKLPKLILRLPDLEQSSPLR